MSPSKDKSSMDKASIRKMFDEFLDKHFGETKEATIESFEVHKAVDQEQRLATFIVLVPNEVDLHGDIYDEVEVEKACLNFNRFCGQANVQHLIQTENADIVESYIAPADFTLDTGVTITKGTWLQRWYFPETNLGNILWEDVKNGDMTGLSIGCLATEEEL